MRVFIPFFVLFAVAASASIQSGITPNFGYVAQADGKLFFADSALKTWFQADTYCNTMGMQLAEVTSKAQGNALVRAYTPTTFNGKFWLAARDSQNLNQTAWTRSGDTPNDDFLPFVKIGAPLNCLYFLTAPEGGSSARLTACNTPAAGSLCEFIIPPEEK